MNFRELGKQISKFEKQKIEKKTREEMLLYMYENGYFPIRNNNDVFILNRNINKSTGEAENDILNINNISLLPNLWFVSSEQILKKSKKRIIDLNALDEHTRTEKYYTHISELLQNDTKLSFLKIKNDISKPFGLDTTDNRINISTFSKKNIKLSDRHPKPGYEKMLVMVLDFIKNGVAQGDKDLNDYLLACITLLYLSNI
ncbi:MAG: hypothetical protein LBG48_04400 [Rickettsiales bacterium]|jgi:hypothetical protein|nr:hypothetical protein [Rickettsiales bacterium]